MEKVIFTKDGLLCSFWENPATTWTERKLSETELPISWVLPYVVEIREGVTLRDVLVSLKPYEDAMSFMFLNDLMGLSFNTVRDALLNAEPDESKIKSDLITLMWVGEVTQGEDPGMSMYPTIMSVEFDNRDPENGLENYMPLHDISISNMLDRPFELDDWLEFFDVDQMTVPIMSGGFSWSFYDFMRGILSELTVFSYNRGIITLPNGVQNAPLPIESLFSHIDGLDAFYEAEK